MPTVLINNADSSLYRVGATFDNLSFALTALSGHWPDGSVWRMKGRDGTHLIRIMEGKAIREDGMVLRKKRSKYEWREANEPAT